MSLPSSRDSSSSTHLATHPIEDTQLPIQQASDGGARKTKFPLGMPVIVNDDLSFNGEPPTTHQDEQSLATHQQFEDNLETPVTELSDSTRILSSILESVTGSEAGSSSSPLLKANSFIRKIMLTEDDTIASPPVVLFMKSLLLFPFEQWKEIAFPLFCLRAKQPIQVINDGETKYTLRPTIDVFKHESRVGYICNLWIDESNAKTLFCSKPSHITGKPDVFIPLGWLVESQGRQQRTTRYVCLWNTSTQPNSLWLAYDYYVEDGEQILIDKFEVIDYYSECYFDDSDDDDSSEPEPEPEQPFDQSYDRDQNSAQPGDQKTNVGKLDAKVSNTQKNALRGYLGRFDLAMIIEDVNLWDASKGITAYEATESLLSTKERYGSVLRATSV